MGLYERADSVYLIAKGIQSKRKAEDPLAYATILNQLGMLYVRMDRYEEARKYYFEAKDIREKILGTDHPDFIDLLNNMGSMYYRWGLYDTAEEEYLKVKKWREDNYGEDHIQYMYILSNMANLYSDMGRYEEAERFYTKILKWEEKALGKDSEDYGFTLSYLGLMCTDLGRYEEAGKYLRESLDIIGNVYGKDHFEYATSLDQLASLYHELGLFEEAMPLYESAVDIREKIFGKRHADYGRALNNLASLYADMNQKKEAEPLYLEAKDLFGEIGMETPEYLWTLNNLAILYKNQGRYEPAENYLKEAMGIREKSLGKTHPDFANTLEDLALVYQKTGRMEEAISLQKQANGIFEQTYGESHLRYAQSAALLANMYAATGRPDDAVPLYLKSNVFQKMTLTNATRFLSQRELPKYIRQFENYLDGFYAFAQHQSADMPQLADACFDNALFHKGFVLMAANQINRLARSNPETLKKHERLQSYHRRIAWELAKPASDRQALKQLESTANTLEKELIQEGKKLGEAVQQVEVAQVQATLKENEVAIEFIDYQTGESDDSVQYAAIMLSKNGFGGNSRTRFIPLCSETPLKALMHMQDNRQADYVQALYSFGRRGASPVGKKQPTLYELIWAPLENALPAKGSINGEKPTIYFSTTGLLNRLNISAIPLDIETVLGDVYDMVRLGSTRSLAQKQTDATNIQTGVLIGGLEYEPDTLQMPLAETDMAPPLLAMRNISKTNLPSDTLSRGNRGETWEYLHWSKKEVEGIKEIVKSKGLMPQLYTEREGTEALFKTFGNGTASPHFIHLATHGFFFPDPSPISGESNGSGLNWASML